MSKEKFQVLVHINRRFLTTVTLLLALTMPVAGQDAGIPAAQQFAARPPRVEVGPVLSAAAQSNIGNYFHMGGGGRVTINGTKYFAGEVEATRQPTGNPYLAPEVHTTIALKGTYRAEQHRWLRFAGMNFFAVVGPAFVNRTVNVADPNPPPMCIRCSVLRRRTDSMLDWGGGVEIVPTSRVAVRFDVTHANFTFEDPFYGSASESAERRTYLKVAVMLRVPSLHRSAGP